jgi:hypothetical protein
MGRAGRRAERQRGCRAVVTALTKDIAATLPTCKTPAMDIGDIAAENVVVSA